MTRPTTDAQRAAKRELENRRSIERGRALNEIAPIPECEDVDLRNELERNPSRWLSTLLPEVFYSAFTATQERFIELVWQAIVEGSWRNIEAYRGIGKTSILSGLLLKALCEGRVRHAIYCTAEGGASCAQASYWFASALYDDFNARGKDARLFTRLYPEIAYPLQRREGRAQRPLTCNGVPLKIEMKSDRIVLPNVPGARCAGSLLRFTSISSGGLRGANHTIPSVGSFRVQCVMLDDVQNDATARSVVEVESIISTIQKSIRGLAGRRVDGTRESLTVLSAITQNQPGDVAERLIEEIPEFGTLVLPFVTSLPDSFDAWKKYKSFREDTLRSRSQDIPGARKLLARYYTENRDELAKNVRVDDERQKESWQVDAIHYALDYWSASESSFWCELQNDARRAAAETGAGLSALDVARKTRYNVQGEPLRRCAVPNSADIMVAHIDAGEPPEFRLVVKKHAPTAFVKLVFVIRIGAGPVAGKSCTNRERTQEPPVPIQTDTSNELVYARERNSFGTHLHVCVIEVHEPIEIGPVAVAESDTAKEGILDSIHEVTERIHLTAFDRDVALVEGVRECIDRSLGRILRIFFHSDRIGLRLFCLWCFCFRWCCLWCSILCPSYRGKH